MTNLTIILGNKTYSSWSLRGWLAIKMTGLPFEEKVVPLYRSETKAELAKESDAPPMVPVLRHGDLTLWDSLAIMEYLAELASDAGLWPTEIKERAMARVYVSEMHSGFAPLRNHVPMDLRRQDSDVELPEDVLQNIERILTIWGQCRAEYADGGDFLFGAYSLVDAAFAPVVVRLRSVGIALDPVCQTYAETLWNHPHFSEWRRDAAKETVVIKS